MAKGENKKKMIRAGGYEGYRHAHSSHMGKGSVVKDSRRMDKLWEEIKKLEKKLLGKL